MTDIRKNLKWFLHKINSIFLKMYLKIFEVELMHSVIFQNIIRSFMISDEFHLIKIEIE